MSVDNILSKYSEPIAELGHKLRSYIKSQLPDIQEVADMPANIIGYGYGPGYKNMICTIIPSKSMMKLGFYKGSELPDPKGLLTGKGKVHKYIEIKKKEDFENPAVAELLAEGLKALRDRIN